MQYYLDLLFFACCFFKKNVQGYASSESTVTLGGGVGGTGGIAVSLTQNDFKNGAYIIDIPGVYTFQEDIVFRPTGTLNSSEPETWMFPDITTAPYNRSPFVLGHFAGIVIQADGVTLDLNGKTFSQSEEHALMQRFFALVELASSPFKPNVGPAAFGDASSFFPASNVIIENGKFGRSSHHAIHGNNNKGVTLRYLDISDFEVAGIALNAADEVLVDTVTVHSTRSDVPVNGRLSAAVFLLQALSRHFGALDHGSGLDNAPLSAAASKVVTAQGNLRDSLYKFLKTGEDTEGSTGGLFAKTTGGVPDASLVAGIMLHGDFTVGGFARTQPSDFSSHIELRNVVVRNLKISPGEIGALVSTASPTSSTAGVSAGNPYGGGASHAHDAVGAVFDLDFAANRTNGGTYVANPLAELQLAFADYAFKCQALTASGCATMADASQAKLLARNAIGQGVVEWAWGNSTATTGGGMTLGALKAVHGYKVVGNKDVMFHAIKGVVGIKLDGVSDVRVQNVQVEYLENLATQSRRSWSALEESSTCYEYTGYANRGLSVASSVRVSVDKISVREASTAVEGVEPVCVDPMFAFRDVAVTNLQNQFEFQSTVGGEESGAEAPAVAVTPEEEATDADDDDSKKENRYSVFEMSVIGLTSLCSALFSGLLVVLIFTCAILPWVRGGGGKTSTAGAEGKEEGGGGGRAEDTTLSKEPKVSDRLLTGRSVSLRGSDSFGDGKNDYDDSDNNGNRDEKPRPPPTSRNNRFEMKDVPVDRKVASPHIPVEKAALTQFPVAHKAPSTHFPATHFPADQKSAPSHVPVRRKSAPMHVPVPVQKVASTHYNFPSAEAAPTHWASASNGGHPAKKPSVRRSLASSGSRELDGNEYSPVKIVKKKPPQQRTSSSAGVEKI